MAKAQGGGPQTVPNGEIPESLVPPSEPSRMQYAATQVIAAVTAPATGQPKARSVPPPTATALPETALNVWTAELPHELDPRLVMLSDPYSQRAASFRGLRYKLASGDKRVIAVTSAEVGEGKTTCAVNLAIALGEGGGAKVLVVEANFRSPQFMRLFGFRPPEGFAAQLANHRTSPKEPWAVIELVGPRIHVLAVDETAPSPPVLDHVAFSVAMARLKSAGYDFIVIDTPPALGGADVNLIVDAVDGVLIAARARRSTGRAVRKTIEHLSPATILGVVLMDA
jgi:Mrp family chromosome partitioning ATPase